LIARSDPMAEASLPAMRARNRPGMAIAAMIPMMATTISNSISVKPLAFRIFITCSFGKNRSNSLYAVGRDIRWLSQQQPECHSSAVRLTWLQVLYILSLHLLDDCGARMGGGRN